MTSNSLMGTSPLSTNANIGNIPSLSDKPKSPLFSRTTSRGEMKQKQQHYQHRTPPPSSSSSSWRTRMMEVSNTNNTTPPKSHMSLPRRHYTMANPSPAISRYNQNFSDDDDDDDDDDGSSAFDSDVPSSYVSSTYVSTAIASSHNNNSNNNNNIDNDDYDKENSLNSSPVLQNLRSKLAQNRLRRSPAVSRYSQDYSSSSSDDDDVDVDDSSTSDASTTYNNRGGGGGGGGGNLSIVSSGHHDDNDDEYDDDDKANILQSSPALQNIKSRLAQNRLRRASRSDTIKSILSSSTTHVVKTTTTTTNKSSIEKVFRKGSSGNDNSTNDGYDIGGGEEGGVVVGRMRRQQPTKKIDLDPRISAKGGGAERILKEARDGTASPSRNNATVPTGRPSPTTATQLRQQQQQRPQKHFGALAMATASAATTSATATATATQHLRQQRTQRCLWDALEVMQSKSCDSDDSNDSNDSSNDSNSDSNGGSSISNASSSPSSLDNNNTNNPIFDRLNDRLDSFKNRRRFGSGSGITTRMGSKADGCSPTDATGGSSSDVESESSSASSSATSSVANSSRRGGGFGSFGRRVSSSEVAASSTFSVSPIAKDPKEPDTIGSYIGSIYLDGADDEPSPEGRSPTPNNTQLVPRTATVPVVPTVAKSTDAQTENHDLGMATQVSAISADMIQQARSFPPRSLDDRLCIDQVPSDVTPENNNCSKNVLNQDGGALLSSSPLSQRNQKYLTIGTTANSPVKCDGHPSPTPSVAVSHAAPSYASSYATGTTATSDATNLFDMLRNTFNHDDDDDDEDDSNGGEEAVGLAMTPYPPTLNSKSRPRRPPLSPMPNRTKSTPSSFSKQPKHEKDADVAQQGSNPQQKSKSLVVAASPEMSPKVVRGTPDRTPCSSAGGGGFLDSSREISPSIVEDSVVDQGSTCQQLEYSFLADALCATNILTTPGTEVNADASNEKIDTSTSSQRPTAAQGGTASTFSKGGNVASPMNKRSHQELSYASIGATKPALEAHTSTPRRDDPTALALDTQVTTLTCSAGRDLVPRKKQRTPSQKNIKKDNGKGENGSAVSHKEDRSTTVPAIGILSIASALDDASSLVSQGSHRWGKSNFSQEQLLTKLVDRVEMLESKIPDGLALKAYLNGDTTSSHPRGSAHTNDAGPEPTDRIRKKDIAARGHDETDKLQERVKWLERILGFGRGANIDFKEEIHDLKGKLALLERRLEEEMELKDEAIQKTLTLTADIEAARNVHGNDEECLRRKFQSLEVELKSEETNQDENLKQGEMLKQDRQSAIEENLRQQIVCLESELEDEKKKGAEKDRTISEMQQQVSHTKTIYEEVRERLEVTNKDLLQDQRALKEELESRTNENDSLRGRLQRLESELESEKTKQDKTCEKSNVSETEENLRQHILCLESQLEAEKKKPAEKDGAVSEEQQKASEAKTNDEVRGKLKQANKKLLQDHRTLKKELASCTKDNDSLRGRIHYLESELESEKKKLNENLKQGELQKHDGQSETEESLRQQILSLESQLEDAKKQETAFEGKTNDMESRRSLEQANKKLLQDQRTLKKELNSCTKENGGLRGRLHYLESELESNKKILEENLKQVEILKHDQSEAEESLRQQIICLESQLEAEKKSEASKDKAVSEVQQQASEPKTNDEETKERLRETNKKLLQDQRTLKNEIVACAKDNDCLRERLLSLAGGLSTKENTLTAAITQLKSLTKEHYRVTQSLKREQDTRQDEVSALQWSLDDMSCQMLKLSNEVNELETENDVLRDELKRRRLEKQRAMAFRRTAMGG